MGTSLNPQAWSTTAADNDDADTSINWSEGQDPATINNSARAMMAALKKYIGDTDGARTAAGTAQAITLTTGQSISSAHLTDGFRVGFWAANDNTGADPTIAIDGLSAKTIKDANGDDLAAGAIQDGAFVDLAYEAGAGVFHAVNIGLAATLTAIGALAVTDGNIIVADGSTWVAESGATARTSLGLGTGDSPQFTGINVGHASDTTITRASAGDIAVEGNTVYRAGGTDVAVADGGTGTSTRGALDPLFDAPAFTIAAGLGQDQLIVRDQSDQIYKRISIYTVTQSALEALGSAKGTLYYHNGSSVVALAPP